MERLGGKEKNRKAFVENRLQLLELTHCPDGHYPIGESQEVVEPIQEDLIPARVQTTCYKKHRYYCKRYEKLATAPCAADEIPNSYLGPNGWIQAVILKYPHALPFNKIAELWEGLCGLKVSEGALTLQRISVWLAVESNEIMKAQNIKRLLPETYAVTRFFP